jgi:hypothetical protein
MKVLRALGRMFLTALFAVVLILVLIVFGNQMYLAGYWNALNDVKESETVYESRL